MLTTAEICCRCAFSPFLKPLHNSKLSSQPDPLFGSRLLLPAPATAEAVATLGIFQSLFGNANLKCLPVQHREILPTFLKGIFSLRQAKPELAFPAVMWHHQLTSDFWALLSFWCGCFPESSAFQLVFQPLSTLGLSVSVAPTCPWSRPA